MFTWVSVGPLGKTCSSGATEIRGDVLVKGSVEGGTKKNFYLKLPLFLSLISILSINLNLTDVIQVKNIHHDIARASIRHT